MNLLVYSHSLSPRLRYVFKQIFTSILKINIVFTDDKEFFTNSDSLKISYTHRPICNELFFKSTDLLFQKSILNQEVSVFEYKKKPCFYPSYTFFMDYNGDVLMCSHDWGKKNILGNLNTSSFIEIWTSHLSEVSRKSLLKGNRNFSPCNVCDVQGNLIGKQHGTAWKKHYEK